MTLADEIAEVKQSLKDLTPEEEQCALRRCCSSAVQYCCFDAPAYASCACVRRSIGDAICSNMLQKHCFVALTAGADDLCIKKHLTARKRDTHKATVALQHTIDFRREWAVAQLNYSMFCQDVSKGLLYIGGWAASGQPVLVRKLSTVWSLPLQTCGLQQSSASISV